MARSEGVPVVAPRAGAWVEMYLLMRMVVSPLESLPVRERGLKCRQKEVNHERDLVAPRAGAWVEILQTREKTSDAYCRSPCGSVG